MKGPGKDNDIRAFRIALRYFDGIFIGFGTAVDEHRLLVIAFDGNSSIQSRCQFDITFVGDDVKHAVHISARLFLNGFDHFWMGMSNV